MTARHLATTAYTMWRSALVFQPAIFPFLRVRVYYFIHPAIEKARRDNPRAKNSISNQSARARLTEWATRTRSRSLFSRVFLPKTGAHFLATRSEARLTEWATRARSRFLFSRVFLPKTGAHFLATRFRVSEPFTVNKIVRMAPKLLFSRTFHAWALSPHTRLCTAL